MTIFTDASLVLPYPHQNIYQRNYISIKQNIIVIEGLKKVGKSHLAVYLTQTLGFEENMLWLDMSNIELQWGWELIAKELSKKGYSEFDTLLKFSYDDWRQYLEVFLSMIFLKNLP